MDRLMAKLLKVDEAHGDIDLTEYLTGEDRVAEWERQFAALPDVPERKSIVGGKPWHIERRGSQYCVVLDAGNETVKCHPTRARALAHMRALYANEKYSPDQTRDERGRFGEGGGSVTDLGLPRTADGVLAGKAIADMCRAPGGGATIDTRTGKSVQGGFAVATEGHELPVGVDDNLDSAIEQYQRDNAEALAEPGNMFGLWHDDIPDSRTYGQVVLDISHVVATHDEAVEYGRAQQQTAIFDLTTFVSEDIRAAAMDASLAKWLAELEGER